MDLVHLHLEDSANEVRKLGAAFVFGGRHFLEAAERYTAEEIVELYVKFREVSVVPENYWRDEFLRVFSRGHGVIPPVDWERYRRNWGFGVFEVVEHEDEDLLRRCDANFRADGFRLSQLRFSLDEFKDFCDVCYPEWIEVTPGQEIPEIWTPSLFAVRRGRLRMLDLLRELDGQE